MQILIWNIRGLGASSKQKILHSMCKEFRPEILVILEPFVRLDASFMCRRFGFQSVVANISNKIWCFSTTNTNVEVLQDHPQFLHLNIFSQRLDKTFQGTFIYASCNRVERKLLWSELRLLSTSAGPWLVGGDFNATLAASESFGGAAQRPGPSDDFNDMILDCGLSDAGFEGEPFTWTNNRVWKRLDRVLLSSTWADLFECTRVSHLPRRSSDHHPLLIKTSNPQGRKKSSFRFQNMWTKHHQFLSVIEESWKQSTSSIGMIKIQQKLLRVKKALKGWNWTVFGNIFKMVERTKQAATDAEKKFDQNPCAANATELNKCNASLTHALTLEAAFWKQKSNCKWLQAGERNTKFFHTLAKKQRAKSRINRILDEDRELTAEQDIQASAVQFFQQLFSASSSQFNTPSHHTLWSSLPKIPPDLVPTFNSIPDLQEIKEIVFSLDPNSTAGPDGFTALFFQTCWQIIAEDIGEAVQDFFQGTPMPRSFTATTIVLIPKT